MHARTAMIGNGFVHLPDAATWLAPYLHDLTVFLLCQARRPGRFDRVTEFAVSDSRVWGRPVGVAVAHEGRYWSARTATERFGGYHIGDVRASSS